jgi:hypothetical protein
LQSLINAYLLSHQWSSLRDPERPAAA